MFSSGSFSLLSLATAIPSLVMGTALPAQNHLYTFEGDKGYDRLGQSVGGVGDINKDGYDDIAGGLYLAESGSLKDAGVVRVYSGKDGRVLYEFFGDRALDHFGWTLGGAGDVNKDGWPDLIVGAIDGDPGGKVGAGYARVFSGKDGKVLYTFVGDKGQDQMGSGVDGAGDINKDGYADLIVGARFADPGGRTNAGIARVFSGKDGSILATLEGLKAGDFFGTSVRSAGDVKLDSYPDLVVGAPNATPNGARSGQVRVFSGRWIATATGSQVIYTFDGETANGIFGYCVSGAGDVNGDVFADIIAGADNATANSVAEAGTVRVFSGLDGKLLYRINGTVAFERLGRSVRGAGDVNKDNYDDFIIGAYMYKGLGGGAARVYSGKDGSVIAEIKGDARNDRLGIDVSAAGDVNKDGYPDVIAGAYLGRAGQNGYARVWSVRDMSLSTDNHDFSIAATKSTQNLKINAGVANAGRLYWLFGSATGTSPGTPVGGITIPLNFDPWTGLTITLANTATLVNTRGTLDTSGSATAQIIVGNLSTQPALIGFVLYHAYLVFDSNHNYHMASNPVTLLFTK